MWRVLLIASSHAHTLADLRAREASAIRTGGSLALHEQASAVAKRGLLKEVSGNTTTNITVAEESELRTAVGTMFNGALQRMADLRHSQFQGVLAHVNHRLRHSQAATAYTTLLPSLAGLLFIYFATSFEAPEMSLYSWRMLEEVVKILMAAFLIYCNQSLLIQLQRWFQWSETSLVWLHLVQAGIWLLVLEIGLLFMRHMNISFTLKCFRLRTWGMFLATIVGFAFLMVVGDVQLRMHRQGHEWFVYCAPLFVYITSAIVLMAEHAITGEGSRDLNSAEGITVLRDVQHCEHEVAALSVSFTFAQAFRYLVTREIQDPGGLEVMVVDYEYWEIAVFFVVGAAMQLVTFFAEAENMASAPSGPQRAMRLARRSLHYIAAWCLAMACQMLTVRTWQRQDANEVYGVPGRVCAAMCCVATGLVFAMLVCYFAPEGRRRNAYAIVSMVGALIAFGWIYAFGWAIRDLALHYGQEETTDVGSNDCHEGCRNIAAILELVAAIIIVIFLLPLWVRVIVPKSLGFEGTLLPAADEPPPPPPKPDPLPEPPAPAPEPEAVPPPPPPAEPEEDHKEEHHHGRRHKHQIAHQ